MKPNWEYNEQLVFCNLCRERGGDGIGTSDRITRTEIYFEICRKCLEQMGEVCLHKIQLKDND